MQKVLRPSIVLFALLTVVTGAVYPLLVTGVGSLFFSRQVAGSLIEQHGRIVGSELISQSFEDPRYFWGRLSATTPTPNNPGASGGSNFGPSNPALLDAVRLRIAALKKADPANLMPVPVDLVTASGSGLDPDISPAAALYQVTRVAAARHIRVDPLHRLVMAAVEGPQWGVFGEPRVNVLKLNLALDRTG